jgi:phosphoglycerate dehydrogenase-like enzyme
MQQDSTSALGEQPAIVRLQPVKVVFGARIARAPVIKALEGTPGVELQVVNELRDVASYARSAEVLIISNPHEGEGSDLAKAISAQDSTVRWVQMLSAGTDGLTRFALPPHLMVSNQGGAMASTVAEHAMALMLARVRSLRSIYLAMEHRVWDSALSTHTSSLEGKRLAIVGVGSVGRALATRARAFGMEITGVARHPMRHDTILDIEPLTRLHEVLKKSDVVAICLALTDETRHLFGAAEFNLMKRGAMLINVARGEIVDTNALRDALRSGHLGSAAIDVVEGEPLDAKASLWDTPSLIISPHLAGSGGTFTSSRIASLVSDNMTRYLEGQPLLFLQDV